MRCMSLPSTWCIHENPEGSSPQPPPSKLLLQVRFLSFILSCKSQCSYDISPIPIYLIEIIIFGRIGGCEMFKLKSIALGIIGLSLLLTLPGMFINQSEPDDYLQPEVCSECHADIYEQWNGSMHSNSHKDPVYEKLFIMASRETNSSFDAFCSKCHIPIDFLTGNIPSADNYKVSEISEKGISCDFCHTINATNGNGGFISSPGSIKRG